MRVSRKLLPVAIASVAMILASCSSSGGGSASTDGAGSTGDSATSATQRGSSAAAGTPIKIGVICTCSGPSGATLAVAGKVAQAWAKSTNAAGGIQGHPIDLLFKDDAGDPGVSLTTAKSFISSHVAAVIDESNLHTTWAQAMDDAKVPVIGGTIGTAVYDQDPNFYPSGQTNASAGYAMFLTAKRAGATRIVQLYCAEAVTCKNGIASHSTAAKKVGLPIAFNASISSTAPNYTAQCVAAQQAHANAMLLAETAAVVVRVAKDCAQQGYTPIYIETSEAYNAQMASAPGLRNNLWITFAVRPYFAPNPAVDRMNSAVDKYYPGLRKDPVNWGGLASEAWTAGVAIEKAVQASGVGANTAVTADVVRQGLDSFRGQTLDGWSPPLTFTAGQPHSVNCWYTARVKDGKTMLANGGKLGCENGSA